MCGAENELQSSGEQSVFVDCVWVHVHSES